MALVLTQPEARLLEQVINISHELAAKRREENESTGHYNCFVMSVNLLNNTSTNRELKIEIKVYIVNITPRFLLDNPHQLNFVVSVT